MRRRRKGRSAAEYFVAFLGVAFLLFVAVVIATSRSCHLQVSPEMGIQPHAPRPTATRVP